MSARDVYEASKLSTLHSPRQAYKFADAALAEVDKELADTLSTLSQEATTVTYLMTHSMDTRNEIVAQNKALREAGEAPCR